MSVPPAQRSRPRRILALVNKREAARVSRLLRAELPGGILVMAAALAGFVAANSPLAAGYFSLRDARIGPESLHLDLSVGHWASDGLLAIFFFMVGLELKREFVSGALRRFSTAIVPVAAAFGGVAIPALIYVAFTAGTPDVHGWAIPTATDIAFAVAVLGLIAPRIPPALRMFLLTLAVVDDLIAITIIAIFYTSGIEIWALAAALAVIALYALVARRFAPQLARSSWAPWLVLLPIGVVAWALFHASGIHATIAGVLLAFTVPVSGRDGTQLAEIFEHRFRPLSSGIAVPVFAFFAAGVAVGGDSRFPFDPIAFGIVAGLVLGKPLGISLITWLLTRFTRARLDPAVRWRELIGVGALAGVGFTVSLLVTELSFSDPADADTARLAVMAGSLLAVAVASALLVRRRR
ncbi:Na+/H+ antiporter NhaA [Leucobacter celer]|uniref:Na+/H+ antiporter NhaA n=1 Tax=Leucobacter celer TaxID=668625 RepID=UPI0006A75DCE|nr:Na+/H+ antiporter NhaA [Leucobacter celer]